MFVIGVLREEEAACAADTGRGQLAQEGAQAVQRRLRRRQSRLYHQARREVPRQIRDRLAHRQGLFRTGESMSEDTLCRQFTFGMMALFNMSLYPQLYQNVLRYLRYTVSRKFLESRII